MLSIAEVSGLIAAGVMTVQYIIPAALVVILVKYLGTDNSAVTWSVINRTIGTTIWPHVIRADAVATRRIPARVVAPSFTITLAAVLLVLAGVLTPLGLREEIVASEAASVAFRYAKDTSLWGRVTMGRPESSFTRQCEWGRVINCPGQYQGVYMNETTPGTIQSVETDADSTINVTIPANFTEMFTSATSNLGNTVSGMFDIQYRRWKWNRDGIVNKGQPYIRGDSRYIGTLIPQDKILLKEGLIVDVRDDPGIGFRNHTIPIGLEHGGTWREDITWLEPVTRCADTNISIELRREDDVQEFGSNDTFFIVDRGAFRDLDATVLESPPWNDNQTLDLFGRAYKAARMYNYMVAQQWNITLPVTTPSGVLPAFKPSTTRGAPPSMFNPGDIDTVYYMPMDDIGGAGIGGLPLTIPDPSSRNSTPPFVNRYPDGVKKLVALNYTAIGQICRGYYEMSRGNDWRGNNLTYPAVQCGTVLGAPIDIDDTQLSLSTYTGAHTFRRNIYVCAAGVRASIKEVDFVYNGTGSRLENLAVQRITDKEYHDARSQPLWAAEHSYDKVMRFDPLWGLVDDRYESLGYADGFYTHRAAKFWLATSPFMTGNFGQVDGYDALAAVSGILLHLSHVFGGGLDLGFPDYSGKTDMTLLERFRRLSGSAERAGQMISLMLTDALAASLVGTKTSISSRYVRWPASLAVDDPIQGTPAAKVVEYRRAIRYDLRYAIPAFIALFLLLVTLLWACVILISSRSTLTELRHIYNQTSAGRLATNLLIAEHAEPKQSSSDWVQGDGSLPLSFGQVTSEEKDYFCTITKGLETIEVRDQKITPDGGEDAAFLTITPAK